MPLARRSRRQRQPRRASPPFLRPPASATWEGPGRRHQVELVAFGKAEGGCEAQADGQGRTETDIETEEVGDAEGCDQDQDDDQKGTGLQALVGKPQQSGVVAWKLKQGKTLRWQRQ